MSLWLAIETATALGSVAIGEADKLLAESTLGARRQAAALAPAIDDLFRQVGRRLQELNGIVMADGPGSFTGLRIGFATMQGLLRELGELEVRTVPSLMAAAWLGARMADGPVAALYDALRGEVFAAVYGFSGREVQVLIAPCRTTVEHLARSGVKPVLAVGDGAVTDLGVVRAWTGRAPVGPPDGGPRASALLALLRVNGAAEVLASPHEAEPAYGRLAEAQVRWEQRHGHALPDPGRSTR